MAANKYTQLPCVSCGKLFLQSFYNQKTCSLECRLAHGRKKALDYYVKKRESLSLKAVSAKPDCVCVECGSVYAAFNIKHKTCSKKCRKSRQSKDRPSRSVKAKYLAVEIRACVHCFANFTPNTYQQTYCAPKCKIAAGVRLRTNQYVQKRSSNLACVCGECGVQFVKRDARQITCSLKCSHKMYSRIGIRVRRARIAGVYAERFDPFEVFDRDGWRCQMCNVSTPKSRRGTMHANAPELDHIYPISKGGSHTKANTQCACRACNMWKSNRKVVGQVGLFSCLVEPSKPMRTAPQQ